MGSGGAGILGSPVGKSVKQTIPTIYTLNTIFNSPSNRACSSGINVLGFLVVLHLELYFYVRNEAIEPRILRIKKKELHMKFFYPRRYKIHVFFLFLDTLQQIPFPRRPSNHQQRSASKTASKENVPGIVR